MPWLHEAEVSAGLLEMDKLDWPETRRRMELIFSVYRHYRLVLEMGYEIGPTKPVYPEYQDCIDPDQIKVPYSIPSGVPVGTKPTPREEMMRNYIADVEHKVGVLPAYQREIIRRRYLVLDDPLPTDADVWENLKGLRPNWSYSRRYFDGRKRFALCMLAYAFRVDAPLPEAGS